MDMESHTADVVVIGAGVNGASIAFHLSALGAGRVCVVDATSPAAGASGKGMGLLRQYHANLPEARLAVRSIETFANWADIVGGTCGYVRTGFLWLDAADRRDDVERNVAMLHTLGATAEILSPSELADHEPGFAVEGTIAAYEPAGGTARGPKIVDGFLTAARRRGVELHTHTPVESLVVSGGRIRGVRTRDETISADIVVVAAGYQATELLAPVGIDLPVQPRRLTIGRIYLEEPAVRSTFLDGQFDTSYRPESNGTALVSMRDQRYGAAVDLDFALDDVDAWAQEDGLARLARRIPALASAPVAATWVGVDGFTPDYRGLYGGVDDVDGLYVAVGSSEKGLKVSPAVGAGMADLITTGESDLVGVPEFSPSRFTHGISGDGEWINVGQLL